MANVAQTLYLACMTLSKEATVVITGSCIANLDPGRGETKPGFLVSQSGGFRPIFLGKLEFCSSDELSRVVEH